MVNNRRWFLGLMIVLTWQIANGQYIDQKKAWLFSAPNDSLKITGLEYVPVRPASPHRLGWTWRSTLGVGTMVVSAVLVTHFHHTAEEAYSQYLHCGSYRRMERLFKRAQRYDRLTGWAYAVMEAGFVVTVFSFDGAP